MLRATGHLKRRPQRISRHLCCYCEAKQTSFVGLLLILYDVWPAIPWHMHDKIENKAHTTIDIYTSHHIYMHVTQAHMEQTFRQHAAANLTLSDDVQFMPDL